MNFKNDPRLKNFDLHEQYKDFADKILSKDAPEIVFTEMRRAYFAGLYTMLALVDSASNNFSEDEAIKKVSDMKQQCEEFFLGLIADAAKDKN